MYPEDPIMNQNNQDDNDDGNDEDNDGSGDGATTGTGGDGDDEDDDDEDLFLDSSLIPANFLSMIKWNKNNCICLKSIIERDLNLLVQLRILPCNVNEKIKKQIRMCENKLVRNFCKLIYARRKFEKWDDVEELHEFSLLKNWFTAIGLDDKCKEILSEQYEDIEEMLNADDEELRILLLRGFNLKLDEFLDISYESDSNNDFYGNSNNNDDDGLERLRSSFLNDEDANNGEDCFSNEDQIKEKIKLYVRDYLKHVLKAHRAMHRCLDALKNSVELPISCELYWDSWDHCINYVDDNKKRKLIGFAMSVVSKRHRHPPKPLPPLPDLRTNFFKNFRANNGPYGGGNNNYGFSDSRSTGSSPLSPPYVPPLSAGTFSNHRSTSSSSSSIMGHAQANFNIIIDPNHVPPTTTSSSSHQPRRATPPPTPPVSHHKRSFILSSLTTVGIGGGSSNHRNQSERKFPTTPPPIRRHQTNIFGIGENFPLTKSKSHEEHLSNRIEPLDPVLSGKLLKKYNLIPVSKSSQKSNNGNNKHNSLDNLPHMPSHYNHQRRRLATEPGSVGSTSPILTNSNCSSPIAVSPENQNIYIPNGNDLQNNRPPFYSGAVDNCFVDSVPRSPRSQAMSHSIHHRFVSTMKINSITCNVCEKQMFFGFKCKDCKYYCHRDCQDKAPNSCGLPTELVDLFKQTLSEASGNGQQTAASTRSSSPKNLPQRAKSQINYYASHYGSGPTQMMSLSSSNPSSPALFNQNSHQYYSSSSSSTTISPTAAAANANGSNNFKQSNSQFQFPPDINITSTMSIDYGNDGTINNVNNNNNDYNNGDHQIVDSPHNYQSPKIHTVLDEHSGEMKTISTIHEEEELSVLSSSVSPTIPGSQVITTSIDQPKPLVDSDKSNNSALVTSGSSGDSIRTVTGRLDSQDSQASDIDQNDRERQWPRQNSVTSREWDIPYDELKIEEEIGTGRFGTVFRGKWHGSVAIKRLHILTQNNLDEEQKIFETFKQEVAIFRKTRHDNLILFMGACMKPPHLAIVTSLCKGLTLYTHIHVRHDKFNLNRTIMIAEQICLGMGYLHARGIIHKDLKTKNIFYENGKVIITDFGLSSVAKLCVSNRRGDWLTVPKGWLCYLAPEIIRTLSVHTKNSGEDLPFSFHTDIYAFGTVWYELLFGCWPFTGQPAEVIIWQVGNGIKQAIVNFQSSKEIKDLLYICWSFHPEPRTDFSKIYDYLEKLPKKRLQRSPSHPAHLQHASEQTFF